MKLRRPCAVHGTRTQITVTVLSAAGTGLMPPGVQPMAHADAPLPNGSVVTPAPQPAAHLAGNGMGNGVQPQVAGGGTPTPLPQPARH